MAPQLRNLLQRKVVTQISIGMALGLVAGTAWKYGYTEPKLGKHFVLAVVFRWGALQIIHADDVWTWTAYMTTAAGQPTHVHADRRGSWPRLGGEVMSLPSRMMCHKNKARGQATATALDCFSATLL